MPAGASRAGCPSHDCESWCGIDHTDESGIMAPTDADDDLSEWSHLMAAAQRGDSASYVRLLRDVAPLLRRVAQRRWPSAGADHIEDVVQDTLLTVHAVRHTYTPGRPFEPWLLGILRHRLADNVRRSVRRSTREFAVANLEETFSEVPANTGEEWLPDRDALHKAIAGLPPAQRRAVELLKLKEMSLKEAAVETGMSITALKVATHRALKSLRAALGGDG